MLYWFVPIFTIRKTLVIASGALFYIHFAGAVGFIPIIFLGLLTYIAGLIKDRRVQMIAIFFCVAALLFYKYTLFFASELISIFDPELAKQSVEALKNSIIPDVAPLAISFFVFEFVHYLMDVLKGEKPIRSGSDFMLFSLFWPTLIAGPIKRYEQFIPSMKEGCSKVSVNDIMVGMTRIALGIIKKLISDNLTVGIAFWVNQFDSAPVEIRWLVFLCIGLRILLDFSGYSDMAIGFGRMMGVKVPENFNWPYLASGPIDFWHRWHISLSTWIRDYIYIPLGGGHAGLSRKIVNGMLAFAICGLWHGAGWNFVVWGGYHGVGIAINNVWKNKTAQYVLYQPLIIPVKIMSWFCTLIFVLVGWLFFFYPIPKAVDMLALMVGLK